MYERRSWEEFIDAGVLWFVNRILHVFGWVIVVEGDNAWPARTTVLGFTQAHDEKASTAFIKGVKCTK
jgi:hypothetical protein